MVTMVRSCIPDNTIWGTCLKLPHKCLQFQKEKHARPYVKHLFRNCTSFDAGAENTQPSTWKWRLVISYDGTRYSGLDLLPSLKAPKGLESGRGWQIQSHSVTIQHKIEDALSKFTRCTRDQLKVVAAGRTDAGVHAWGQVAHFTTPTCFDNLERLHTSLNGILPPDIRIREVSPVHPDFHARYSARRKTYQYKAYVSPVMEPFQHNYACHVRNPVDVAAMQEAASYFVGSHNFSAFANASTDGTAARGIVRELLRFTVLSTGPQLVFEVEGRSFLYKQVRNMVALLMEVGKGLVPPSIVKTILLSEDRQELAKVATVAPAHGLYLMSVAYDDNVLEPLPSSPEASFGRWLRHSVRTSA